MKEIYADGERECSEQIIELMKKILAIYKEYNPDGKQLSMYIHENGKVTNLICYNSRNADDAEKPIDIVWEV